MNYDFHKAFTYIFKDEQKIQKLLILFAVVLVGAFVPVIGAIISTLFLNGYYASNLNRRIFKPDGPAQEWNDISKIALVGLKMIGFTFVLSLLASLVALPVMFLTGTSLEQSVNPVFMLFCVFLFLCLVLYSCVAVSIFATNLKFASFFKFSTIKFLMVDKLKETLIFVAICILIGGATVVLSLVTFGIAIFVLVPYLYFVVSELQAQYVRKAFQIGENQA